MRPAIRLCTGLFGILYGLVPMAGDARAQDPPAMTEQEAIARLMARDPRVRLLEAHVAEAQAVQAARTVRSDPRVSFLQEDAGGARDVFLLGHQEVPLSGRMGLLREAGRLAVDATRTEVDFEMQQRRAALREAFTALLLEQERDLVLRAAVADLEDLVGRLRAREEAGEGSTYDRLRGARALLDRQDERSTAAVRRLDAQGRLAGFLGPDVDPAALVLRGSLGADLPDEPAGALIAHALAHRLDYRAAEVTAAQFDVEARAAGRLRVPSPVLSAGVKQTSAAGMTALGYQIGVDLAVPVFDGGRSATGLASVRGDRARTERAVLRTRIEAEVRTAHATLAARVGQAERYRSLAAQTAEPLVAIARVAYEEGEIGILELVDAYRQATDAALRALDLAAQARLAAIEFERVAALEAQP